MRFLNPAAWLKGVGHEIFEPSGMVKGRVPRDFKGPLGLHSQQIIIKEESLSLGFLLQNKIWAADCKLLSGDNIGPLAAWYMIW